MVSGLDLVLVVLVFDQIISIKYKWVLGLNIGTHYIYQFYSQFITLSCFSPFSFFSNPKPIIIYFIFIRAVPSSFNVCPFCCVKDLRSIELFYISLFLFILNIGFME